MHSVGLDQISFPVYKLGTKKPTESNNILFYSYLVKGKEEEDVEEFYIVDDKNIDQLTLAQRRLVLLANKVKLYRLKNAIFFIGDLIKLAKKGVWFIDSEGRLFEYHKTRRINLVFKKITRKIPMNAGGAIIEVEGIGSRFKVLYNPKPEDSHAGLLQVGNSYILYGLYDAKYDNTFRYI